MSSERGRGSSISLLRICSNLQARPPASNKFLIADGGCVDNVNIFGSLRRGLKRIVLWDNSVTPLLSPETYDPYSRPPRSDDLSQSISAYFGYSFRKIGQELRNDAVFSESDFPRVVAGLQKAQASGNGAVATFHLQTVENRFWGVGAYNVTVTFYHAGRAFNWEQELPPDVAAVAVPDRGNVTDPSNVISHGVLKNFPFFGTLAQLDLTPAQARMLAHLSTWVVLRNREHFQVERLVDDVVAGGSKSSEGGGDRRGGGDHLVVSGMAPVAERSEEESTIVYV